jgi:hypothetical protein
MSGRLAPESVDGITRNTQPGDESGFVAECVEIAVVTGGKR